MKAKHPKVDPLAAREQLAVAALQRIADGGDCGCEDHSAPECCANVSDFYCPECFAQQALDKLAVLASTLTKAEEVMDALIEPKTLLSGRDWIRSEYFLCSLPCVAASLASAADREAEETLRASVGAIILDL